MKKIQQAASMFRSGFLCSQAILVTYGLQYGIEHQIALKLASGFGGGIGRSGQICGAVSGAIMVLGLAKGNTDPKDATSKTATYNMVKDFMNRFGKLHGTVLCNDLLGRDIGTQDGYRSAQKENLFKNLCPKFVESAATLLEEMLG